jgi:hypothetical protein
VASFLSKWWEGAEFRRTPSSGGWAGSKKAREDYGATGDIVCSDPSFPFCVEVKSAEGWELEHLVQAPLTSSLFRYWGQTVEQTPVGKIPLLIFTKKFRPWYVMFDTSSFLPVLFKGCHYATFRVREDLHLEVSRLDNLLLVPKEATLEALKTFMEAY